MYSLWFNKEGKYNHEWTKKKIKTATSVLEKKIE